MEMIAVRPLVAEGDILAKSEKEKEMDATIAVQAETKMPHSPDIVIPVVDSSIGSAGLAAHEITKSCDDSYNNNNNSSDDDDVLRRNKNDGEHDADESRGHDDSGSGGGELKSNVLLDNAQQQQEQQQQTHQQEEEQQEPRVAKRRKQGKESRIGSDYQATIPLLIPHNQRIIPECVSQRGGGQESSKWERKPNGHSDNGKGQSPFEFATIHHPAFLIGIHLFGKNFTSIASIQPQARHQKRSAVIQYYYVYFKNTHDYIVWKYLKADKNYAGPAFLKRRQRRLLEILVGKTKKKISK